MRKRYSVKCDVENDIPRSGVNCLNDCCIILNINGIYVYVYS